MIVIQISSNNYRLQSFGSPEKFHFHFNFQPFISPGQEVKIKMQNSDLKRVKHRVQPHYDLQSQLWLKLSSEKFETNVTLYRTTVARCQFCIVQQDARQPANTRRVLAGRRGTLYNRLAATCQHPTCVGLMPRQTFYEVVPRSC